MAKEWYKLKGFRKNPLHLEPNFGDKLFGYEVLLDELFYRIDSGSIIFIEGNPGKTALLMKLIERYKGKGKVAYVNCENIANEPNIKLLIDNGKKHISQHFPGMPKGMIILLDNVSHLSATNSEKIKFYFDKGNIQALIITGNSFSKASIPESLKHRIGNRVYKLRELTKDEQVDIIQERLEFKDFFPENLIRRVAEKTSGIKELLMECDTALFLMSNEDLDKVNESIIEKLFHEKDKKNDMV
jgi:predicted AAA+ superfamily ATPase